MRTKKWRTCRNDSCTQATQSLFCSRRCQTADRNVGGMGQLPDIWIGMDLERAVYRRAADLHITVRDLVINLLENETGVDS